MSKGFVSSAKSYMKNVGKHAHRLITRQESHKDALQALTKDTKKLGRAFTGPQAGEGDRHEATSLTKKGRKAYNVKNYGKAEEYFRDAILADKTYAFAYTYLGHTLYQQGRVKEAVVYWKRAIEAEPGSEAAEKARSKILYVEKSQQSVVQQIEERFK